jgi:hypothetical protein
MEANYFSGDEFSPTMSQTRSTAGIKTPNLSGCEIANCEQPVLGINLKDYFLKRHLVDQ